MRLPVLLDADTGIDDSIAILYALKNPALRVIGITTGCGNTSARQAAENTLRVIALARPGYEVPVIIGARKPLATEWQGPAVEVHGENGLGDAELPPSPQRAWEEGAEEFLLRAAEREENMVLITLGRLTNLARALQKYPRLSRRLRVVAMGGTLLAPGNVSPVAEANIAGDPEAAELVLTSGVPVTLVGLDVTTKTRFTPAHIADGKTGCAPENRAVWDYIEAAMRHYLAFYHQAEGSGDCPLHDPSAVIAAAHPELFQTSRLRAHVECGGAFCRGMVVADRRLHPFPGPVAKVCLDVDSQGVLAELMRVLKG